MKTHQQGIPLSDESSENTVVKTVALFSFRALRVVAGYIAELPAVASQAATDVQEAWEESRGPNE
jgi:hypothetical protein